MTNEERQAYLDNIPQEDLAKVQAVASSSIQIDEDDLLVAELASRFGWQAYRDYQADLISSKEMAKLLTAARKLDSLSQYRLSQAVFIGAGSAQAKKPSQAFKSMTRHLLKNAEVKS